jgi:hypothetical protein
MEKCEWYTVPLAALTGRQPTEVDAPSAMFSLADPEILHAILRAAGFAAVRAIAIDRPLWFGANIEEAVTNLLGTGPARAVLQEPAHDDAGARELLAPALGPYAGEDGVRIPGSYWLVHALRPGRNG